MNARRVLALLLLLPAVVGCGLAGAQNRPLVLATVPAAGASVPGPVATLRIDYDEPVTLFATYQVQVLRDGIGVGVTPYQLPGDTQTVRVRPTDAAGFEAGRYVLRVLEGLVLNAEQHYTLEPYVVTFDVDASGSSIFAAAPATRRVVELDPATLAVRSQAAGAVGQVPQAVVAVTQAAVTRVLVQLEDGGGAGAALAHFVTGAAAFTPVTLTTSGGNLTAPRPCLLVAPGGEEAYAAYRDVAAQRTRLARVRTADAVETGSLLLSPEADALCFPTALLLAQSGTQLVVVVQRAGLAHVCRVDRETFTELDQEGGTVGVQAWQPGVAAGPAQVLGSLLLLAPDGPTTADMEFLDLTTRGRSSDVSTIPGSSTRVAVTLDSRHVLAGLDAGTPDQHLAVRPVSGLLADAPFTLSDDVGGLDQGATRVLDLLSGSPRSWALLDADVLARLESSSTGLSQVDEDPGTTGVQARLLPGVAAGATRLGRIVAVLP